MNTFCVKCKKPTGNNNIKYVVQNGRKRMTSICSVCKKPKSQFVTTKKQGGKGADEFISKLPYGVELHLLGNVHKEPYQKDDKSLQGAKDGKFRRMKFAGPNTKTDERYAKGERGINDLDHAAMFHDFAYKSKDPTVRNRSDEVLYEKAKQYLTKPRLTTLDKIDANIVKAAMKLIKRKV